MERFAAQYYCHICSELGRMSARFALGGQRFVNPADRHQIALDLESVGAQCRQIGLVVTAMQCETTAQTLRLQQNQNHSQVGQSLTCIVQVLMNEMSTNMFMHIFSERVYFYEQENLFGDAVEISFPGAGRDIKAAGSCYAADRNTACVMHLMRVLELGLNVLADRLGVIFERRNWENIINDIEKEIETRYIKGKPTGKDWAKERDFYSGAAKDFRYFKGAWRNHAMHLREHYDATEARSILEHVSSFMEQLSKGGLKESLKAL